MFKRMAILSVLIVSGMASTGIFAIGGSVTTDTKLKNVVCKNVTTGQSIVINSRKEPTSWDCATAGLSTQLGDTIKETLNLTVVKKIVYFNDFSLGAGAEWSDQTTATANGEYFLGASAYGFGAGSNSLSLANLPAHGKVTISFDLYIIQSWDGNGPDGGGPDNWQLTADGNNLLFTNFDHNLGLTQAYPNQLPPHGDGGSFPPYSGAFANGHLGFGGSDTSWGDSTYRFSYTFAHTASTLNLTYTSFQTESRYNEGWGLDNVLVTVTP